MTKPNMHQQEIGYVYASVTLTGEAGKLLDALRKSNLAHFSETANLEVVIPDGPRFRDGKSLPAIRSGDTIMAKEDLCYIERRMSAEQLVELTRLIDGFGEVTGG